MKIKKLIIGILLVLVALAIIVALVVASKLDAIVKAGIETAGPSLTKTTVQLDDVTLHLFSGSGAIKGLVIGSPKGYNADYTMKLGNAQLALKPSSLFSDKVVIDDLTIEGPEIILQGSLNDNNLTALQKNVNDAVGGGSGQKPSASSTTPSQPGAQKKLQVNHFKLAGAKVHLQLKILGGKEVTVAAPDVEMSNLGTGPDGITAAELVKDSLNKLTEGVLTAAAKSAADLGKEAVGEAGKIATGAANEATKDATGAVGKATDGLKNLFKK